MPNEPLDDATGREPEPPEDEAALGASPGEALELVVPALAGRERLDQFLAARLRDCSRSYVQKLIKSKLVLLNGSPAKASKAVAGGERLEIGFPPAEEEPAAVPQDIPLEVVFEDEALLVVNKPAGMPTHPSCGHARGTLANAMAFHCAGRLSGLNGPVRPGIVHRLDMDTSGVILVAKSDPVHRELARQFAAREVSKTYVAIVHGAMRPPAGVIDRDLGRHPVKRKQQAVLRSGGRNAVTEYRTAERFLVPGSWFLVQRPRTRNQEPGTRNSLSLVELRPKTGRTHQIRVHLASSGCPILCDGLYGRETAFPAGTGTGTEVEGGRWKVEGSDARTKSPPPSTLHLPPSTSIGPLSTAVISRQALHAAAIEFTHPVSGQRVSFAAPPPADFAAALELLRRNNGNL